jgi:hypothetical protein
MSTPHMLNSLAQPSVNHNGEAPSRGDTFETLLREELARARFFHRTVTVLAIEKRNPSAKPLPYVPRPVDSVVEHSPWITLILLPEMSSEEVGSMVDRWVESEPGGYGVGAAAYPDCSASSTELIKRCIEAARKADPNSVRWVAESRPPLLTSDAPVVRAEVMHRLQELTLRAARTRLPVDGAPLAIAWSSRMVLADWTFCCVMMRRGYGVRLWASREV